MPSWLRGPRPAMVSSDSRVVCSPEGGECVEDVEGNGDDMEDAEDVDDGEERTAAGGEGMWEAELMVSVRHGARLRPRLITTYGRFCGASQPFRPPNRVSRVLKWKQCPPCSVRVVRNKTSYFVLAIACCRTLLGNTMVTTYVRRFRSTHFLLAKLIPYSSPQT